jgi:hypothetical protein
MSLVFEENAPRTGKRGGISHFGFRLTDPGDIEATAKGGDPGRRENPEQRRVLPG